MNHVAPTRAERTKRPATRGKPAPQTTNADEVARPCTHVPCLYCGQTTPLTFVGVIEVDGVYLAFAKCEACLATLGECIPYKHQTLAVRAANHAALKRWHARRDRLLRRHLTTRVLPVARALAANAEALIRKAAA